MKESPTTREINNQPHKMLPQSEATATTTAARRAASRGGGGGIAGGESAGSSTRLSSSSLNQTSACDWMRSTAAAAAVDPQTMTTTTSTETTTMATEQPILTAGKRTLISALRSYQYVTSGFYKFLARFSGKTKILFLLHLLRIQ